RVILAVSSVGREVLFAYSTLLSLLIAIDRFIATYAYAWYESQCASTFIIFLLLTSFAEAYSISLSVSVVQEFYSISSHLFIMATGGTVGFFCFWLVHSLNERLRDQYRANYFGISEYNIARSYQIRENVVVLRVLRNIAVATVHYTIPPFILFMFFVLTPADAGLDEWRFITVAIYDLFIALFAIIAPLRLLSSDIRFERGLRRLAIFERCLDRLRRMKTKYDS
ncbi:hypothetical protein PFISCL1PPCAC_14332, partial [Pristionchus fissidentatus]